MGKPRKRQKKRNTFEMNIPLGVLGDMKLKLPKNKKNDALVKSSSILSNKSSRCEMWDCDISKIIRLLADIATNLWRARKKNFKEPDNIPDELKKILRHYRASWDLLTNAGFDIHDHTNETYPEGSPLKVIAFQPMAGYGSLTVAETVKPTIYFNDKKIQEGEVVVAMPIKEDSKETDVD